MRESFFKGLYETIKKDPNVVLLMSDTGFNVLDNIRRDFPGRCLNVGIAEQNMIGVAAGLAMSGKIVYTYAIIPFVTMRCYEEIRVDICAQKLNVKMIGIGAGMDYCTLGPTHHAHEDIAVMRALPDMSIFVPCDRYSAEKFADMSYQTAGPAYVRLERYSPEEQIYDSKQKDFLQGCTAFNFIRSSNGKTVAIVAAGRMVQRAMEVSKILKEKGIGTIVIDLYRPKPLNKYLILANLRCVSCVVAFEEHSVIGGIGSAVAELIAEEKMSRRFLRIGLPDEFCREYGNREFLHRHTGLDTETVVKKILDVLQ